MGDTALRCTVRAVAGASANAPRTFSLPLLPSKVWCCLSRHALQKLFLQFAHSTRQATGVNFRAHATQLSVASMSRPMQRMTALMVESTMNADTLQQNALVSATF